MNFCVASFWEKNKTARLNDAKRDTWWRHKRALYKFVKKCDGRIDRQRDGKTLFVRCFSHQKRCIAQCEGSNEKCSYNTCSQRYGHSKFYFSTLNLTNLSKGTPSQRPSMFPKRKFLLVIENCRIGNTISCHLEQKFPAQTSSIGMVAPPMQKSAFYERQPVTGNVHKSHHHLLLPKLINPSHRTASFSTFLKNFSQRCAFFMLFTYTSLWLVNNIR